MAAIRQSPEALRYLDPAAPEAEDLAILTDARTLRFVHNLSAARILHFISLNILVCTVLKKEQYIPEKDILQLLQHIVAQEDVPEKYIRNFMNCRSLNQIYHWTPVDKLHLVYQYGSKRAKRIAVDERLRFKDTKEVI